MKLNKSLNGLVQAPLYWHLHLEQALIKCGFKPSDTDPCLYLKNGILVHTFIDDYLFFAKDTTKIDALIADLAKELKLTVKETKDDNVFVFLGVSMKANCQTGKLTLTQQGLISKILQVTGMQDCNTKGMPCGTNPLRTDANGQRPQAKWDYPSVVGMLMYLCSNTRPDIQYAVHQCARFSHNPRASHEQAILHICRYLQGTRNKGMTFKPDSKMQLDCYVDAYFAGLWNMENEQDPVCVKSRTGFILTLGGCPLLWVSKLQTEVALSTTEAEYIAMSQAMRELIPMRTLLQQVGTTLSLDFAKPAIVWLKVFEDNNGALKLATAPNISPRTKHIAVKYHFFREAVGEKKGIHIMKIDTTEQIADMFTKGLPATQFQYLRKKLIGW